MQLLRIDVERVRTEPLELEFALNALEFDVADDAEFRFDAPIEGRLTARIAGGTTVYLTGSLRTEAHAACVRCLRELPIPLAIDVKLAWIPEAPEGEAVPHSDSEDLHTYRGDAVYPLEALREELLLALPTLPKCTDFGLACVESGIGEPPQMPGPAANSWREQMARLRIELGGKPER